MQRILASLILLIVYTSCFAGVSIKVESKQIRAGESTRLIISTETNQTYNQLPDLTPLLKDFSILSTEQRMSYSFINGQAHSLNQWVIVILPKHSGTLSIPSLQIGNEETLATTLEVGETIPQQELSPGTTDIRILTEVNQKNPYINQQVIYTVKILLSDVNVTAPNYNPPHIDNALVTSLQDAKSYRSKINNQDYEIRELRYAIFPQKSGELIIHAPSIEALTIDKPIAVKGKETRLNVKPIPNKITSNTWIPAKKVNLSETYSTDAISIQEGNTLVREITVQTTGLPAQLLPHLTFSSASGFSVYPEKPREQNDVAGEDIRGTTTIKLTYIPNKSGEVTLPGIQLHWFNTVTGNEEISSLPEHKLNVVSLPTTTALSSSPLSSKAENSQGEAPMGKSAFSSLQTKFSYSHWPTLFFALAWLMTLALWYRQKNRTNQRSLNMQLKQACFKKQPATTRDLLLEWACLQWPTKKFLNIVELEKWLPDGELKQEINKLSLILYSKTHQSRWEGEPLWHALCSLKRNKARNKNDEERLPPLNRI